jgi:DNA-directed RNA polymerase sigma subunit (sigma70/sigma32)
MKEKGKRRAEMLKLRRRGMTLKAIGKMYGISKQRVHQLLGSTGKVWQLIGGANTQ